MLLISEESPSPYDDEEESFADWFYSSLLEEVADEIIEAIKPTVQSDNIRRSIAQYIEKLIQTHFLDSHRSPPQVFLFGSVPLKTYLPDGDMDLTVFASSFTPRDLCNILREEEKSPDRMFHIRNVRFIAAEVEVIKCFVDNIPVDICFFKSGEGGLHSLLFLQRVDEMIGRDELFKRSVLLIKAWCFYESRILGSSHSLLSTFGLEIMILHVLNYAKDLISGPFSVLCMFLEYYSNFDWDQFGVSLSGIVVLSHLPRFVVTDPPNIVVGGGRYFTDEQILSLKREKQEEHRTFPRKFLNIFDPFVEYNNVGRSVSKGNSRRIRMAMKIGYEKLKAILEKREETAVDDLNSFFVNTIHRNAHGARADVKVHQDVLPVLESGLDVVLLNLKPPAVFVESENDADIAYNNNSSTVNLTSRFVTQATDSDEEMHKVPTPVTASRSVDYPPVQVWRQWGQTVHPVPIIRPRFRIYPPEIFYQRRPFPYQHCPPQTQFSPYFS